jgi:hypothetical protein
MENERPRIVGNIVDLLQILYTNVYRESKKKQIARSMQSLENIPYGTFLYLVQSSLS